MFYAHFVLSKKGPLARIWLAAHWDKKLTKAHVFETNIASSVEAILEPKVKMALRTSGHLLLGVVRIYSRKAKYLLADCNEAFVKIKMAFRPGVVDLPEDNREANIAAITLPETFQDFDTTMADLNDLDVQAQFSVNQSRPEEITMREEVGNINLMPDDGFGPGDMGLGLVEKEGLRQVPNMDDTSLLGRPDASGMLDMDRSKDTTAQQSGLDLNFDATMNNDGFGQGLDPLLDDVRSPAGVEHDDSSDDDNFGGGMDHDLFTGEDFMGTGGLFEEPTSMVDPSMPPTIDEPPPLKVSQPVQPMEPLPGPSSVPDMPPPEMPPPAAPAAPVADQTTIIQNEEEAFTLEPLDVTHMAGTERKTKRRRKLIVDDHKGIPSESMKMQLSDTSDIVTTLDLAPPTKKLMHWKETGGVEKLFALPGRHIPSKFISKVFTRNLTTKPCEDEVDDEETDRLILDDPNAELAEDRPPTRRRPRPSKLADQQRAQAEAAKAAQAAAQAAQEQAAAEHAAHQKLAMEASSAQAARDSISGGPEPPMLEQFQQGAFPDQLPLLPEAEILPEFAEPPALDINNDLAAADERLQMHTDAIQQRERERQERQAATPGAMPAMTPRREDDEDAANDDIFTTDFQADLAGETGDPSMMTAEEREAMTMNEEYVEKLITKRSHHVLLALQKRTDNQAMSFFNFTRNNNRKQAASKFYTVLVLKKQQAINIRQEEPFGDLMLTRGSQYAQAMAMD